MSRVVDAGLVARTDDVIGAPGRWDEVVDAAGAPLFYRARVLDAYRSSGLEAIERVCYVAIRSSGRLVAVLPAYVLPPTDPLGTVGRALQSFNSSGGPLVLSHSWHWYDTWIPARDLTPAVVDAACEALAGVARVVEAQAFGFVNVTARGRLFELLRARGEPLEPVDRRFRLDLRAIRSVDEYVATLPRNARQSLRRHLRRAADAGAEVTVDRPPSPRLADVVASCGVAARRHSNDDWYAADRFERFVRSLPPESTYLLTVRVDGRAVAGAVCFADGRCFHNWAGGAEYAGGRFSAYAVLFCHSVDVALRVGARVLEGGRRNDDWKLRHGLEPVELYAAMRRTSGG